MKGFARQFALMHPGYILVPLGALALYWWVKGKLPHLPTLLSPSDLGGTVLRGPSPPSDGNDGQFIYIPGYTYPTDLPDLSGLLPSPTIGIDGTV